MLFVYYSTNRSFQRDVHLLGKNVAFVLLYDAYIAKHGQNMMPKRKSEGYSRKPCIARTRYSGNERRHQASGIR